MHLVIPFAGSRAPWLQQAMRSLALPRLQALWPAWHEVGRLQLDEDALSLPHETFLAQAWGCQGGDGLWPFAALAAQRDGLAVDASSPGSAWGLLTPAHWQVSTDDVVLRDPAELALTDAESRAFFDAVAPLFEGEGWALHHGAAMRWYAQHQSLATLPTPALGRVVQQSVLPWLARTGEARRLRRLQSEVQMLLYTHPLNEAREARGELTVNSFWLSGTGLAQALPPATTHTLCLRLEPAALSGDPKAWSSAWAETDANEMAALAHASQRGEPVQLTLCGEHQAVTFAPHGRSRLQRWFSKPSADLATVLAAL